jgi:hypothetical protein
MKAALVNLQGIVENVILCSPDDAVPEGLAAVFVADDSAVSAGWTYEGGEFSSNQSAAPEPSYADKRRAEYPPMSDYLDGVVKGDQAQIDAYVAACLAVKAKYPKEQA